MRIVLRYELSGSVMQTVDFARESGECVYSQTACMCWMDKTSSSSNDD